MGTFNPFFGASAVAKAVFGFDRQSARRLGRNLRRSEVFLFKGVAQSRQQYITNQSSFAVTPPAEGIPAKVGEVMGSAECEIMMIDDSVLPEEEVGTGFKKIVYNNSFSSVSGNNSVMAIRNRQGKFIVDRSSQATSGLFRVFFNRSFEEGDMQVEVTIEKSDVEGFVRGNTLTARNEIRLSSSRNKVGYCLAYGDGTVEIVTAECPDEENGV